MSALGHFQTLTPHRVKSRHCKEIGACPFYPRKRTSESSHRCLGPERGPYSITSSARASSVGGIVIPSAFAVC